MPSEAHFHSFGSQRAHRAMADHSLGPVMEAWAVAESLFPGRVYDHEFPFDLRWAIHLYDGVLLLGVFGDTIVWTTTEAEYRRSVAPARAPVQTDTVVVGMDPKVDLVHRDDNAGEFRVVHLPAGGTRADVAAIGAQLPFEDYLDDPAPDETPLGSKSFPVGYANRALLWLFGVTVAPVQGIGRGLAPLRTHLHRFRLLPPDADRSTFLHQGRPVVNLPPPQELDTLLGHTRYRTGGGDWMVVHLLEDGRALFVACDQEDRDTMFAASVPWFRSDHETDLLAGAPSWWGEVLREQHPEVFVEGPDFERITMVFGWEDGRWTRAIGTTSAAFVLGLLEDGLDPSDP